MGRTSDAIDPCARPSTVTAPLFKPMLRVEGTFPNSHEQEQRQKEAKESASCLDPALRAQLGATVATADGSLSLVHPELGECYHSHSGAAWEAEQLYINASAIRDAFAQDALRVLDVGLGLGYNACSTLAAWQDEENAENLSLLSLENDADLFAALNSGEASWQQSWPEQWRRWVALLRFSGKVKIDDEANCAASVSGVTTGTAAFLEKAQLCTPAAKGAHLGLVYEGVIPHSNGKAFCHWRVLLGDAQHTLAAQPAQGFDFIWQDAFSPQSCPALWTEAWFSLLAQHACSKAQLLTYSVAGAVKTALSASGWDWQRIPTPGPKKWWLRAKRIL